MLPFFVRHTQVRLQKLILCCSDEPLPHLYYRHLVDSCGPAAERGGGVFRAWFHVPSAPLHLQDLLRAIIERTNTLTHTCSPLVWRAFRNMNMMWAGSERWRWKMNQRCMHDKNIYAQRIIQCMRRTSHGAWQGLWNWGATRTPGTEFSRSRQRGTTLIPPWVLHTIRTVYTQHWLAELVHAVYSARVALCEIPGVLHCCIVFIRQAFRCCSMMLASYTTAVSALSWTPGYFVRLTLLILVAERERGIFITISCRRRVPRLHTVPVTFSPALFFSRLPFVNACFLRVRYCCCIWNLTYCLRDVRMCGMWQFMRYLVLNFSMCFFCSAAGCVCILTAGLKYEAYTHMYYTCCWTSTL